jgi:hypothetical protein
MRNEGPDSRLYKLLCSLPPAEAANTLMRRSDRELAICLLYLEEEVSRELLSRIGKVKRNRVETERQYVSRMGLRYPEYRLHLEALIAALSGRGGESIRSYIRPRRD